MAKLVRGTEGKKVLGVCAGLAQFFGWENGDKLRIAWVVGALLSFGWLALITYLLLWFAMPEE